MWDQYKALVYFFLFGLIIATIPLFVSKFIAPKNPSVDKLKSYECGFDAFSDARFQFDIRFYLIAILFIIFDLEMAFLFPWAILIKSGLHSEGFFAIIAFLIMLFAGFCYEWKKGALEWE